jgi:hypothetical protein
LPIQASQYLPAKDQVTSRHPITQAFKVLSAGSRWAPWGF